jgi:hypothetical protein
VLEARQYARAKRIVDDAAKRGTTERELPPSVWITRVIDIEFQLQAERDAC